MSKSKPELKLVEDTGSQLQDEDLLRMRNFGKKSLDEMKERLRMRGFLPPDEGGDAVDFDPEAALDDLDEEE